MLRCRFGLTPILIETIVILLLWELAPELLMIATDDTSIICERGRGIYFNN